MDSVTQIVLGATVAQSVAPKSLGRKAALWGAALGTFPDLDVLIPMGNAVADFTYHRSFSHSLWLLTLITPLFMLLITRTHQLPVTQRKAVMLMVWLTLITHPLLDSFTTYGTQLFWPLTEWPVSISSIFIIDPGYTLPLLVCLVIGLTKISSSSRRRWLATGLSVSCLYLLASVGIKHYVEAQFNLAAKHQGLDEYRIFTTPTPFNVLLWRGVLRVEDGYYETYHSLFDAKPSHEMTFFPSADAQLQPMKDDWSVQRLVWFTNGFYKVEQRASALNITDLRMGFEPQYAFVFNVAQCNSEFCQPVQPELLESERDYSAIRKIWERIFSPEVSLVTGG